MLVTGSRTLHQTQRNRDLSAPEQIDTPHALYAACAGTYPSERGKVQVFAHFRHRNKSAIDIAARADLPLQRFHQPAGDGMFFRYTFAIVDADDVRRIRNDDVDYRNADAIQMGDVGNARDAVLCLQYARALQCSCERLRAAGRTKQVVHEFFPFVSMRRVS